MYSAFDISTSGLVAQRARLNAISGNIANVSTTHDEDGHRVPYQPRFVVFETDEGLSTSDGAAGVRVASVETTNLQPLLKYEPGHPDADADGNVAYPNINLTHEFVNALEATRSYEANIGVMEVTKDLAQQTLRIVA